MSADRWLAETGRHDVSATPASVAHDVALHPDGAGWRVAAVDLGVAADKAELIVGAAAALGVREPAPNWDALWDVAGDREDDLLVVVHGVAAEGVPAAVLVSMLGELTELERPRTRLVVMTA